MRVVVSQDAVEVRLAWWEKVLGLMRDVRLARGEIVEAVVVADPVREVMGSGLKVGLRLPWLAYVARTIRLDEAFLVRRGVPALSLRLGGERTLKRLLLSTPRAAELAEQLRPT